MGYQNVTIEDVAKAAEVSRQTVSRVINHAKNVSTSARENVEKAIDDLGYVPNLAARRMGGSRSYVLMTLIARGSADYLPIGSMLAAGLDICSSRGFHIMFEQVEAPSSATQFAEAEAHIGSKLGPLIGGIQPDGILVMPPLDHCAQLLSALKKRGIAVACLAEREEFGRIVPGLDEAAFAEAATQKLVDLGHRQVGFVPSENDTPRSQRRIEGYRRKLAQARSRAQRHFVAPPTAYGTQAEALARSWLSPTIRPTAIITESARTALAFAKVARELDLAVPDEISIVSLEDTQSLSEAKPPISALHLPYGDLFAEGCTRLMDQASDRSGHDQICKNDQESRPASTTSASTSAFAFAQRGSIGKAPRAV